MGYSYSLPPANEVWGKVIFSQASVGLYLGGGVHPYGGIEGVCIQWGEGVEGLHLGGRGVCIQGDWEDPSPHRILWDTVNKQAVRILLECILVANLSSHRAIAKATSF